MKRGNSGKKSQGGSDMDFDNKSDDSDISVYTNEKVFNGALKKLMKANMQNEAKEAKETKEFKEVSTTPKDESLNFSRVNKKMKSKINLKIEDNLNNANGLNTGSNNSPMNEEPSQSLRKVNSPISFRPNIQDEMEKVNINEGGVLQVIKEEDVSAGSVAKSHKKENIGGKSKIKEDKNNTSGSNQSLTGNINNVNNQ